VRTVLFSGRKWSEQMASVVFAIVLGVVGLAVSWFGYRARLETERTIQQAIEKGVLTDAALIPQLRQAGLATGQRLIVLGILALFVAAGVVVFALVLGSQEPESVAPLLAIAAFAGFLALGLVLSGWWVSRTR
jgi:Na+/melibiose symporter-like transporter